MAECDCAVRNSCSFTTPMNRYEFELRLTPGRYLDYYRGKVRHIVVRCSTGESVQFPASLVQRFVGPEGINGNFALTCDDQNKCIGLELVAKS